MHKIILVTGTLVKDSSSRQVQDRLISRSRPRRWQWHWVLKTKTSTAHLDLQIKNKICCDDSGFLLNDRFFEKNRWFDSLSISIFLPAADCFDYARVYEHLWSRPSTGVRLMHRRCCNTSPLQAGDVGLGGW